MKFNLIFFSLFWYFNQIFCLPTLYEFYTANNGTKLTGLIANGDQFTLNGKSLVIFSGSLHYFRIVPQYWPETLAKFKAAGLNTVQFYLPWNLHEPKPGKFDFESFGLNLTQFLINIKSADMFAIVRPGPYICAEWEYGGLPPWLLKDNNMRVRSQYPGFMKPVRQYFSKIFEILNRFQFSKNGGPIIALQIENEYFGAPINHNLGYLKELKNIIAEENNFTELLFASDPVYKAIEVPVHSLNLLQTANLNINAKSSLTTLKQNQPNKPIFVTEFWPGWFDSWGDEQHHQYSALLFEKEISDILFQINGSVNFYMFIGGTNFGFYNGDRIVTSYDYDAPLTESGNYTLKYWKTKELYDKLVALGKHPNIQIPSVPKVSKASNYGYVVMQDYLTLNQLVLLLKPTFHEKAVFMEYLDDASGFGYILYRFYAKPAKILRINGSILDRAIILINEKIVKIINDHFEFIELEIEQFFQDPNSQYTVDILVLNLGRKNYGCEYEMNNQRKGINDSIFLDNFEQRKIQIFTFDLNETFLSKAKNEKWHKFNPDQNPFIGPRLYRASFVINSEPQDTFLLMPDWSTGNVFINNFNIGRYNSKGPQKTLYIPSPLLKRGFNVIQIFETGMAGNYVKFNDYPKL